MGADLPTGMMGVNSQGAIVECEGCKVHVLDYYVSLLPCGHYLCSSCSQGGCRICIAASKGLNSPHGIAFQHGEQLTKQLYDQGAISKETAMKLLGMENTPASYIYGAYEVDDKLTLSFIIPPPIAGEIATCNKCSLAGAAGVPGQMVGNQATFPPLMVVGEAPGAIEDHVGKPFCGSSGKLLRAWLKDAGINDYYLTNVCKHRPMLYACSKCGKIKGDDTGKGKGKTALESVPSLQEAVLPLVPLAEEQVGTVLAQEEVLQQNVCSTGSGGPQTFPDSLAGAPPQGGQGQIPVSMLGGKDATSPSSGDGGDDGPKAGTFGACPPQGWGQTKQQPGQPNAGDPPQPHAHGAVPPLPPNLCCPVDGQLHSWYLKQSNAKPTDAQVKACLPLLMQEIRALTPRVILAVGSTACHALGLKGTMAKMHGMSITTPLLDSSFNIQPYSQVIGMYHPSYVLRMGTPEKLVNSCMAVLYQVKGVTDSPPVGKESKHQLRFHLLQPTPSVLGEQNVAFPSITFSAPSTKVAQAIVSTLATGDNVFHDEHSMIFGATSAVTTTEVVSGENGKPQSQQLVIPEGGFLYVPGSVVRFAASSLAVDLSAYSRLEGVATIKTHLLDLGLSLGGVGVVVTKGDLSALSGTVTPPLPSWGLKAETTVIAPNGHGSCKGLAAELSGLDPISNHLSLQTVLKTCNTEYYITLHEEGGAGVASTAWAVPKGTLELPPMYSVDIETTSLDPRTCEPVVYGWAHVGDWTPSNGKESGYYQSHLDFGGYPFIMHHACFDLPILLRDWKGVHWHGTVVHDTMLIAKHLGYQDLSLKGLYSKLFKKPTQSYEQMAAGRNIKDIPIKELGAYCQRDAQMTAELMGEFAGKQLPPAYHEIDRPLIPVLVDMTLHGGFEMDKPGLHEHAQKLAGDIQHWTDQAWWMAGQKFNVNSRDQVAEILHTKLGLPVLSGLTPSGKRPIVDDAALEKLAHMHPLPGMLRAINRRQKELSAFVMPWLATKGNRISSIYEFGAETGRLSCHGPNLQQVPEHLRLYLRAPEGYFLLSFDYSQIEFRVAASESHDPVMQAAFEEGLNLHAKTAELLYGAVTPETYKKAKVDNFALLYQGGPGVLVEQGVPWKEAHKHHAMMRELYPVYYHYCQHQANAARNGPLVGLYGRKHYIPDGTADEMARQAVNRPTQGGAVDICKKTMVEMRGWLAAYKGRFVAQIHDEIIIAVPDNQSQHLLVHEGRVLCLKDNPLSVPIDVSVKGGNCWGKMVEST